jgi:hypothetical protein
MLRTHIILRVLTADLSTPVVDDAPETTRRRDLWARLRERPWLRDASVFTVYVLLALFVTARLWADPAHRLVYGTETDSSLCEWFMAHAARIFIHGDNPFYTVRLNVPVGVNLAANTAMMGLGVPMIPVTLLFGPNVSVVVLTAACLAGTAAGWYILLSRQVVSSRVAAAVGAGFCGFAPAIVNQAPGHLHVAAQWAVPLIIGRLLALHRGRWLRDGVLLGLLITYQAFVSEEILLFTAIGCSIFFVAYAVQRRDDVRQYAWPFLRGLAAGAATAGVLLAYPLAVQFFGRMHNGGLDAGASGFGADVFSYSAFPGTSLSGHRAVNPFLTQGGAEINTFFGLPLLILAIFAVIWLWRSAVVRALAVTALACAVLSLGTRVTASANGIGPGPWRYLAKIPPMNSVIPSRFGFVVAGVIGVLLALAGDRIARSNRELWPVWAVTVAMALVPLMSTPYRISTSEIPQFITQGAWHRYITDDRSMVPAPLPSFRHPEALTWTAAAGLDFTLPRGYFLTPRNDVPGAPAEYEPPPRPTATLLDAVAATGKVPALTDEDRRLAVADLRYWRAAVVVLPHRSNEAALLATLTELLGPGQQDHDVWVWDVRGLTAP